MNSTPNAPQNHWNSLARQWDLFGSPLRPSDEDVRFVQESLRDAGGIGPGGAHTVLLLGVTPEYSQFPWLEDTTLIALDHNPDMISQVWTRSTASREQVLCGDWLDPPVPPRSIDTVVGDGVLSVLPFPDGYKKLGAVLATVSRPGATWNLRLYCRPHQAEPPARVIRELMAMNIGSFHAFKLRLAMALHGYDDTRGVRVDDVWRFWISANVDVPTLVSNGWSREVIGMIDAYKDSPATYWFPPLDAAVAALDQYAELKRVRYPTYELGDRCPSVTFRLRG